MTTEAAREKLIEIINRTLNWSIAPDSLADAILAAFPQIAPSARYYKGGHSHTILPPPQIAPPQDVVEGAREVIHGFIVCGGTDDRASGAWNYQLHSNVCDRYTNAIAAFATARAEKERAEISTAVRNISLEQFNYHQSAIDMRGLVLAILQRRKP